MTRPDYSKPWRITGSAHLEDAARDHATTLGLDLSKLVDRAIRELLTREGREVPPPLPPPRRGPKRKAATS